MEILTEEKKDAERVVQVLERMTRKAAESLFLEILPQTWET